MDADRQVLGAVLVNLLQNAFKFTRPSTTVTLNVGASSRACADLRSHDQCGGFPGGTINEMFRPFEQRSADRTGLGLGLAFSRWGVGSRTTGGFTRATFPIGVACSHSTFREPRFLRSSSRKQHQEPTIGGIHASKRRLQAVHSRRVRREDALQETRGKRSSLGLRQRRSTLSQVGND